MQGDLAVSDGEADGRPPDGRLGHGPAGVLRPSGGAEGGLTEPAWRASTFRSVCVSLAGAASGRLVGAYLARAGERIAAEGCTVLMRPCGYG